MSNLIVLFLTSKLVEMLRNIQKISIHQILFLIVALIGAFLFSFKINTAPISYDEFSVINRTSFDTLKEVYSNTKTTDVHPPLLLFFLFFWLKIAGTNIFLIKLPSLLAGISSIFLLYNLVKKWFNSNVAIVSTAFFISIQFTILYTQLVRPYIFGLFFTLLFATFWTRIIRNKSSFFNYLAYILAAILCIYNHHYSLLQAGIIGVSGLFIIKKSQLKPYLILNIIICLAFLPNLYLMSTQINYQGMTYIPKANFTHIFNYLFYIFQFSIIPVIAVFGVVCFSLIKSKKPYFNKYTFISFSWFLFPLIIGCSVSYIIKPVMPIRALIFSFPFLIIFLFSFVKNMNKKVIVVFTFLILFTNIYALVFNRKHYQIFQKDIAKTTLKDIQYLTKNKLIKNPYVLYSYPESNMQFYRDKFPNNFIFENLFKTQDKISYRSSEFREKIASLNNDALILSGVPKNLIAVAKEYYPYLIYEDKGFKFDFYCFSKNNNNNNNNNNNIEKYFYTNSINFEDEKQNSKKGYSNVVLDSSTSNHYFQLNNGDEWGPGIELNTGDLIKNKYDIIETSVSVLSNDINRNGHLVFEIIDNGETIVWYSSQFNDFISESNKWQTIYFSEQLNELGGSEKITPSSILRVYFWNQDKKAIAIDNVSIKIKEGNEEIYSLIYDF